jgi:large subunit ribosomal protein L24|tara:strand:- start:19455 stop:19928 length:474 start_codon:yes stop_codon:yes gene_type:complete
MKNKFSKVWKASKQPRKQRKYMANAPIHIKRKKLNVNLSKALRKGAGKRTIVVRKDDKVKILRGKFKGKTGKIIGVFTKIGKVEIGGIQVKKQDGSKVAIKLQPSNLQIIEMAERGKKSKPGKEEKIKEKDKKPESKGKTAKENEPLKKVPKTEKNK